MGVEVQPDPGHDLPRRSSGSGATAGTPSWTSSTRRPCSRRTVPPPPATSPCRWRCGRRSRTATSSCWRSGTPAGPVRPSGCGWLRLIWGRLDTDAASGLAVSLPEACRLSDALASSLRVRLGLEVSGAEITERIRQLRAQMERIRDQVTLEPAGAAQQAGRRAAGPAGPTTQGDRRQGGPRRRRRWAARAAGDRRRHLRAGPDRRRRPPARGGRPGPPGRATGAPSWRPGRPRCASLAAQCVRRVDPAPRYAVPDVAAARPGAQVRRRARDLPAAAGPGVPGDDRRRSARTPRP